MPEIPPIVSERAIDQRIAPPRSPVVKNINVPLFTIGWLVAKKSEPRGDLKTGVRQRPGCPRLRSIPTSLNLVTSVQ